jgi:hypothetical protein
MMAEGPRNNWYSFRPNQKSCQLVSNLTYFCPKDKIFRKWSGFEDPEQSYFYISIYFAHISSTMQKPRTNLLRNEIRKFPLFGGTLNRMRKKYLLIFG